MEWYLQNSEHFLIVTAKGFPDFGTNKFLNILALRYPALPMYYLGDADPYGADIYFTFLFGSLTSCIIENKEKCSTLYALQWIGPFFTDNISEEAVGKKDLINLNEKDKLKAYSLLSKPYLADAYLNVACSAQE